MKHGENVTMACSISGFPLPSEDMVVLRNEVAAPIAIDNISIKNPTCIATTFKVVSVSALDAGGYRCRITLPNTPLTSNTTVTVQGKYWLASHCKSD